MICPWCGTDVAETSARCPRCAQPLHAPAAWAEPEPPPEPSRPVDEPPRTVDDEVEAALTTGVPPPAHGPGAAPQPPHPGEPYPGEPPSGSPYHQEPYRREPDPWTLPAPRQGDGAPASFGIRLGARLLDLGVLLLILTALTGTATLISMLRGGPALPDLLNSVTWRAAAPLALLVAVYRVLGDAGRPRRADGAGQGPGRAVVGIGVVRTATGQAPGLGLALLRLFATILTDLPLFLGSLSMLNRSDRATLADRLTGTSVVRIRRAGGGAPALTGTGIAALALAALLGGTSLLTSGPPTETAAKPAPPLQTPTKSDESASRTPAPAGNAAAQATEVDRLLDASARTRRLVADGFTLVQRCPDIDRGLDLLAQVEADRRGQLARTRTLRLNRIQDGEALRRSLTAVFDASLKADLAYQTWAESQRGCQGDTPPTPDREAGDTASLQATRAKNDLVQTWNPIATEHDLNPREANAI